jgi:hypothetical protein
MGIAGKAGFSAAAELVNAFLRSDIFQQSKET